MLFANHIDSLAAADAILADVWLDNVSMPVVDCLGEEFLSYVKDGMTITVKEDGVIVVAKFDGGDQLGQCISGCDFG